MAFTVMLLSAASSNAATLVKPFNACLVATYAALFTDATTPCTDDMLMMRPHWLGFLRISGIANRIVWNAEDKLIANKLFDAQSTQRSINTCILHEDETSD